MKAGNITIRRLRKCIRVLRSVQDHTKLLEDGLPRFTMKKTVHRCGSPGCVLGWYASSDPKRFQLLPASDERLGRIVDRKHSIFYTSHSMSLATWDFPGLSPHEKGELFADVGCGNAQTPSQAADYIESFIARKLTEG